MVSKPKNYVWFPCKYFTLNAASLTDIAVAMKLPMDFSNSMPHVVDQAARLGSMYNIKNIIRITLHVI
ncbi:hypothetical protein Hanom_Chr08g00707971 [Helianthus anomalus]